VSPVSRGRRPKGSGKANSRKSSKGARSGNPQIRALQAENETLRAQRQELIARNRPADDRLSALRRRRQELVAQREEALGRLAELQVEWWTRSATQLLTAAGRLVTAQDAAELEEATVELVTDQLLELRDELAEAVDPSEWLESLIDVAGDDDTDATWYLLHGLAAISPPAQALHAQEMIKERSSTAPPSPSWLATVPEMAISPQVRVVSDTYGLRSAVLVPGSRPGGPARTYLLDVDLCPGYAQIVASGWHPTPQAAVTAWARAVGPSAVGPDGQDRTTEVAGLTGLALGNQAVDRGAVRVLAELLPFREELDAAQLGEEVPRERVAALYRDHRIVADLATSLVCAGLSVPDHTTDLDNAHDWASREASGFVAWCTGRGIVSDQPDALEDVEELLEEWAAYTPGRLRWACSPHRVISFAAQLVEEWAPGTGLQTALSLVEPLALYCLERSALPEPLAEPIRAAARAVTADPFGAAGRAVDTWRTAANESEPYPAA
jgi:hypothetical protein